MNMEKIKKIRGLSSTYNRSRALLPFGTVVKSCRNGINSCSSSNELDARNVQPHQATIKRKKTTPERRVPAFPTVMSVRSLSYGKRKVSDCSKKHRSERNEVGEVPWDHKSSGTSLKGW